MHDKILVCKDCGQEFVFTVSEQEFFAEKGFANDPTRCLDCRVSRRRTGRNESQGSAGRREMYPAVCAQCGMETRVPFKPSGERPVYCRDCFTRNRSYA